MAPEQTTSVERYRRPRGQHPRSRRDAGEKNAEQLPEYLEAHEIDALIRAAPNPRARLLFLIEWRAGLRISEALAVETRDLSLDTDRPIIRVRQGKGSRARIVPVHAELHAALTSALQFGNVGEDDRLIGASRSTADRWIKAAAARAAELGGIPINYLSSLLSDDWTLISGYRGPGGEIDQILVGPRGCVRWRRSTSTAPCSSGGTPGSWTSTTTTETGSSPVVRSKTAGDALPVSR